MTTMVFALATAAGQQGDAPTEAVIENCDIGSIKSPQLPASDAGVLINLHATDGQPVKKGMVLATIDDREAKALYEVKRLDFEVALQAAKSDADVRNAIALADVARIAFEKYKTINETQNRAISQLDLLERQYQWEKAKLTIEKSKEDSEAAKTTAESKKAEMDAARVALERRRIVAPFDGIVSMTYLQEGEWVQPGDPVLQLVAIDTLRISGRVDADSWARGEIENRKVTVEVELPRGRVVKVPGKIVYVSPVVDVGSVLPVSAEIETPMENGRPLVYAGMHCRMTIHTDQPAVADTRPTPPSIRSDAAPARPTISPASRRAPGSR
jgi:multidrug efflux pump subunit AcrA (membrane-fusion protein)